MAVETGTILQKMQRELTNAQKTAADEAAMHTHVANIQLLCELLQDETAASPETAGRDVTTAEARAMMGQTSSSERLQKRTYRPDDHNGANGESIFDF